MTKNGAIISTRATPRPQNDWSNKTASTVPRHDRDDQHRAHQQHGVEQRRYKCRVGQQVLVVVDAGEAVDRRVQQVVALEREPQRHRQRHDHPERPAAARPRVPPAAGCSRARRGPSSRAACAGSQGPCCSSSAPHRSAAGPARWRAPGPPAAVTGVAGLLHRARSPWPAPWRAPRRPSSARSARRRCAGRPALPIAWNSGIATYWIADIGHRVLASGCVDVGGLDRVLHDRRRTARPSW